MTNSPPSNAQLAAVDHLTGIDKLLKVVALLRDPDTGCPWDLKQTHTSLRPYMLEEAYEAVEAMDSQEPALLKEELGDVLLQVALHAQLAKDNDTFDFNAVAHGIADKLIHRHPHVFGDVEVDSPEAVTRNWEAIKQEEKANKTGKDKPTSAMDSIGNGLPALMRANKTSKKAVKEGFKWPHFESLWSCVMSEYDELRADIDAHQPHDRLEDELGDCLFATVSLAHHLDVDPEVALHKATNKFMARYRAMETLMDKPLADYSFEELDEFWKQAKGIVSEKKGEGCN